MPKVNKDRFFKDWTELPDGWGIKHGRVWFVLLLQEHSDRTATELGYRYECVVKRVDLDTMPEDVLTKALREQGLHLSSDGRGLDSDDGRFTIDDPAGIEVAMVYACSERVHGLGDHLVEFRGDNERTVLLQGRGAVDRYKTYPDQLAARLNRPINTIGTTAAEAGRGDVLAGLRRDDGGDAEIKDLMRRLHKAVERREGSP